MSQTTARHRATKSALFVTALIGVVITMGSFGAGAAHAEGTCNIADFKNPDATLDTTGYLACVQAASVSAPKPAEGCPTADLELMAIAEPSELSPGQQTQFDAVGFAPGSEVKIVLCSPTVDLGTYNAGSDGRESELLTIPAGTVLGAHTIAAVGKKANGLDQVAYAAITVVNPSTTSQSGALPVTGSDNGRTIAIGAALVVLGGAAVFGSAKARRPALVDID